MSKTPKYDAKVSEILDSLEPGERTCDLTGEKWQMSDREIGWYKKFNVPPSKYSPMTRKKLVHSYFLMFDIWYNKHADTGKPIVSGIHPGTGVRVLPDKEWFDRDFISEGREVDLDKPFFDQLYSLSQVIPRAAGYNFVEPKNSVAFISFGDVDSYFVLACRSKRCYYCGNSYDSEDCAETSMVTKTQDCYHLVRCDRMHNCRFASESYDCINCDFIFDCRNCEFCFGATNKRNKKYLWFNEQLSKEEWERRFAEVDLTSWKNRQEYESKYYDLIANAIWSENYNINADNCVGEYLNNVSNILHGYYSNAPGSHDCEECTYFEGGQSHNCYMIGAPISASDCYYSVGVEGSNLKFAMSINSKMMDSEYCESCYECSDCFGCVGLRHKKFCILNKQYSEEEYWQKLDEIKCFMMDRREYGDMPPANFSTQVYTGSGAAILFGSDIEEGKKLGAVELDPRAEGAEGPEIEAGTTASMDEIPDRVEDINALVGKPFLDPNLNRRYTYIKPELELYRKLKVAPPRMHPVARGYSLYDQINMPMFSETNCAQCDQKITVALNRAFPERTIYCKACYHRFIEQHG